MLRVVESELLSKIEKCCEMGNLWRECIWERILECEREQSEREVL